jgi:hypothetical protein
MFETIDRAEIPIPEVFRDEGQRAWAYVEHPLHVPWFHLVYRYPMGGSLDFDAISGGWRNTLSI